MEFNGDSSRILKCSFPYKHEVPDEPFHNYVMKEIARHPGYKIAMVNYYIISKMVTDISH